MTDVSKDGGVIKKVITEGSGSSPKKGNTVQVNYVGRLEDGTEFDASGGYPFSFVLGEGKVIKGWDVAFKHMKKGEKAVITVRGDYAYGAAGSPPDIPPNATLVFDVELLDIKTVDNSRERSDLERLAKIRAEREAAKQKRADDAAAKSAAPAPAPAAAPSPKQKGGGRGKK